MLKRVTAKNVMVDVSPRPTEYEMEVPYWQLECGHFVTPPSDIFGERFPKRMHCRECEASANSEKGRINADIS